MFKKITTNLFFCHIIDSVVLATNILCVMTHDLERFLVIYYLFRILTSLTLESVVEVAVRLLIFI